MIRGVCGSSSFPLPLFLRLLFIYIPELQPVSRSILYSALICGFYNVGVLEYTTQLADDHIALSRLEVSCVVHNAKVSVHL